LAEVIEAIHLLTIWIVCVKRSLLWLHVALLSKLVEAGLLRLLLEPIVATIAILESSLLLTLHARWLRVRIVQESCILRLLLVLVDEVTEPIDSALLLVSLVVSRGLILGRLRRRISKQEVSIALFQLPLSKFFLLFAKPNSFCQIIVVIHGTGLLRATFLFLFSFVLTRLKGQPEFQIFLVLSPLSRLMASRRFPTTSSRMPTAIFLNSSNARLPRLAIGSLGSQALLV
jgi:hypothetical protein